MKKLAVISMSGGLDSATLCAEALEQGYDVYVVNFNYGQKNIVEMKAFQNLLKYYKNNYKSSGQIIGHKVISVAGVLDTLGSIWQDMRDNGDNKKLSGHDYYMPSRNLFFAVISTVIGEIIAMSNDYGEIEIGLGIHKHSEDAYGKEHRDYWDITPAFAEKLANLLSLNDVVDIKLFAPFVDLTKSEVVKKAIELKVPINQTWTCYNPDIKENVALPCLKCEACIERQLAGINAGVKNINDYAVHLDSQVEGISNE